ncbi:MAG: hypothetical protein LUH36_04815, partial [Oscillospiraceae bacterium]|nr:hypothetical protein [Oscillospiraceae bacterium]
CCGYLLFFAVSGELRARGYGTAALKALFRRYEGLPIALDFEPVDEAAENNAQRIRRKAFYLRSGFHETGLYTRTCGRGFELVCHGPDPERPALTALLEQIHTVFTDFSPRLYDTP